MSSEGDSNLRRMTTWTGLATSHGFVAGPAFLYTGERDVAVPEYEIPHEKVFSECARYYAARAEARRQIEALAARFAELSNRAEDNVFANHLAILDDALVVKQVEETICNDRLNVEAAIRRVVGRFRAQFGQMDDPYLRERLRDVDDIECRFMRILRGEEEPSFATMTSPAVVVATDLTPSETLLFPRNLVLGFATDRGSATSHVALLARALGIPAVVGLGDLSACVTPGDAILLDGSNGTVTVNPDAATAAAFDRLACRSREVAARLDADRRLPGRLKDDTPVRILANMQPGVPLAALSTFGVEGIGLYRTEYLWLESDREPTEEEQVAAYGEAVTRVRALLGDGARVVFRCLDLGGDKLLRGAKATEANPFLGNRSIRWLLGHRDVFKTQLRAILRVSALGKVAVMFPMIATLEELVSCNQLLGEVKGELAAAGIGFDGALPRGAMIETPAAALVADHLAREVDFLSIGTNDLVQYTLAADRGNEQVAHLQQPAHPAILRLVEMTCRAAEKAGIAAGVCGESAADPVLALLWVGLGVRELSMSPSLAPTVKKVLRGVTAAEARAFAGGILADPHACSAAGIYRRAEAFLLEKVPEFKELRDLLTAG